MKTNKIMESKLFPISNREEDSKLIEFIYMVRSFSLLILSPLL